MNQVVRMLLVIAALVAFKFLANVWSGVGPAASLGVEDGDSVLLLATGSAFGLLLLAAWLGGRIAKQFGLPMVTGFLLIGVGLGPSALGVIDGTLVDPNGRGYLLLINDLAIALIALTAGGEMQLSFLKGSLKSIVLIVAVQVAFVLGVSAALFTVLLPRMGFVESMPMGHAWRLGLLLAVLASSSSPAIAIAVVTELRARGPLTQLLLSATIFKDLVVIMLFAVAVSISAAGLGGGEGGGHVSIITVIVQHIFGSVLAGLIAGAAITWYLRQVSAHLTIFLVLTCFGIALVSQQLHLDPLITALIAGLLMRNAWAEISEDFFDEIEDLSLPVYCVFFAVAGTRVDLASLAQLWVWAVMGVGVRLVLLWAGTTLGARVAGVEKGIANSIWGGFASRAGVAIALAGLIVEALVGTPYAAAVFNFALGMIALDELIGPLLLKWTLTRSGEAGARGESEGE